MDLFAIDDSVQASPTRDGMGPLVAVGGLHVSGSRVRILELALDALCRTAGFPSDEEFKWSPDKSTWMRRGLVADERERFFLGALELARGAGATAIVAMEDVSKANAIPASVGHEDDVTTLFLERAQNHVPPGETVVVVFDRPGGHTARTSPFCPRALRSFVRDQPTPH